MLRNESGESYQITKMGICGSRRMPIKKYCTAAHWLQRNNGFGRYAKKIIITFSILSHRTIYAASKRMARKNNEVTAISSKTREE